MTDFILTKEVVSDLFKRKIKGLFYDKGIGNCDDCEKEACYCVVEYNTPAWYWCGNCLVG
jgi:hypothetical protein